MTITYINRKMDGLCVECGQPSDGRVRCRTCQRRQSIRRYEKGQERQSRGLCVRCGEPSERRLCPACRAKEKEYNARWRAKRGQTNI